MLVQLRVRDLVLIDELDLELSSGFNVLTGETGAGKSLVVTAVDLLLGRRARGDLVRRDASEAEIEGLFDISDELSVKQKLEEAGLPVGDELLIRRVIPAQGRHRCYVNGRLSSLGVLSELSAGLASVMSQHEQHALLDPARQLDFLDGYGGLSASSSEMAELFGKHISAVRELEDLRSKERDRAARLDYLSYQLAELERLSPLPGELEVLDHDIERLKHQEVILEATRGAANGLYESDGSIFEQLGALLRDLEAAAEYDDSLETSVRQLNEALVLVEETARSVRGYGGNLDDDPSGRLSELEERREELRTLVRKHGMELEQVIKLAETLAVEVETLSQYEAAMTGAQELVDKTHKKASKHAVKLGHARQKSAATLGSSVTRELRDLQFMDAQFAVLVEPEPARLGPSGADRVEFVVALNPGEGVHALRKVASGGELSRLMLAVKRALAGVGPVGTYVFDEVDTGIGGPVAAAVGKKLAEVATHHQVICISHLPQIAGCAKAHFYVSKSAEGGRTASRIRKLDEEGRLEEMARMLGGESITKKTRDAARELMIAPGV